MYLMELQEQSSWQTDNGMVHWRGILACYTGVVQWRGAEIK